MTTTTPPKPRRHNKTRTLRRFVEFQGIRKLPLLQYRNSVRKLYDGPAGAALALASFVSLHEPLIGRLLRNGNFRLNERKSFLDVGSGAGQIMGHLLRMSAPDARLVSFDLSHPMLKRAEQRLKSDRPISVAGDLMRLPFADESFDFITCGWVIEHLPDPVPGLKEISRVLRPGGSVLILATENSLPGTVVSHTWKCRTYSRAELQAAFEAAGLPWGRQFWFTPVHRLLRIGGILVEATKPLA